MLIDLDVENPNSHLFFKKPMEHVREVSIPAPVFDMEKCDRCGKCADFCQYNAISILGEKLLLGPLFRRGDLPKLLGSSSFSRRTLRFAWHLTTVLLCGIAVLVTASSLSPTEPRAALTIGVLASTFAVCSLVSLIGARGKHFSWWVFLIIAVLLWFGA